MNTSIYPNHCIVVPPNLTGKILKVVTKDYNMNTTSAYISSLTMIDDLVALSNNLSNCLDKRTGGEVSGDIDIVDANLSINTFSNIYDVADRQSLSEKLFGKQDKILSIDIVTTGIYASQHIYDGIYLSTGTGSNPKRLYYPNITADATIATIDDISNQLSNYLDKREGGEVSGDISIVSNDLSVLSGDIVQTNGSFIGGESSTAERNSFAYGTGVSAIGENAYAIGKDSVAGCYGWYYKYLDLATGTFYLTTEQPDVRNISSMGPEPDVDTTFESGFAVNDVISYVNMNKRDMCATIIEVNGNKIVVGALADRKYTIKEEHPNHDDWTIFVPEKPTAGQIWLGECAFAEGSGSKAINAYSHAEGGRGCLAYGQYGHAEGKKTKAGYASHAEGESTEAVGTRSHAEGYGTHANNDYAHAEGYGTYADGKYSHAEGWNTRTQKYCAHVEGNETSAYNECAHAEGYKTLASGLYSHAEGNQTSAVGTDSHTFGNKTYASGYCSFAGGDAVSATNSEAFAIGWKTTASGQYSFAGGQNTKSTANQSFAIGNSSEANGGSSFAAGWKCVADKDNTYAFGLSAIADHKDAFVWNSTSGERYVSKGQGTFNINPQSGLSGFYIGANNFVQCVLSAVQAMNSTQKAALKTALGL